MVVRVKSNQLPKGTLFAVSGGVLVLVTAGLAFRHHFLQPELAACELRTAKAERMPVRDGASPYTVADLQALTAGEEWGLTENAQVFARNGDRSKLALKVSLKAGVETGGTAQQPGSGVSFNWLPALIDNASSACLTYSLKLDAGFPAAGMVRLPGLVAKNEAAINPPPPGVQYDDHGEEIKKQKPEARRFLLQLLPNGGVAVRVSGTDITAAKDILPEREHVKLASGRWVKVSQEVVLNTPGQADGAVRIWLDGKLVINRTGVRLRKDRDTTFAEVNAEVFNVDRKDRWSASPANTSVSFSPFIVRRAK